MREAEPRSSKHGKKARNSRKEQRKGRTNSRLSCLRVNAGRQMLRGGEKAKISRGGEIDRSKREKERAETLKETKKVTWKAGRQSEADSSAEGRSRKERDTAEEGEAELGTD